LRRSKRTPSAQGALLILNFLPLILFFARFVPAQPVSYWQKLLDGGPEQRRVAETLNPKHLRLLEQSLGLNDMLFPNNMGHLQKVHTVHGYSALQPPSLFRWPPDVEPPQMPIADFTYSSEQRGTSTGELTQLANERYSRVRCDQREVTIREETLNTLTASIAPGPADKLLRTDTFYPGWRAELNTGPVSLEHGASPFSTINLPASDAASIVTYIYRPSHFILTISLSLAAGIAVVGMAVFSRR
jgi:hypothetical protein